MPLELAVGLVRIKIDRAQLRAEIKATRREIVKGLSGIRVRVDIDAQYFRRQATAAGKAAGRAAGAAASAGFREGMRTGASGMVPSGGTGMTARRGMVPGGGGFFQTSPGTFLVGGSPLRGLTGPAGRTFAMGGAGQARLGTTFGGRSQRGIGGSPFQPAGYLGYGRTPRFGTLPSAAPNPFINQMSGGAWASYLGQLGQGPAVGGGGGGRTGTGRSGRGGRGFRGMGGMGTGGAFGSFASGFGFGASPMLAASALYGGPAGAAGYMSAQAAIGGVKSFAEFEDAIKWVQILQREAGAAESSIARLENQARQLGRTTVFSATEAANAMAVLTKRGYDAEQVYEQMPNVLNLAAAGELDIAEAADIVASTQKQFQMDAKDTRQIVDLLAKASLESASDVRTIGHALGYVGPVAHQAGLDLKETIAIITMLEDGGLKSSRAGTGLARVLAKLADDETASTFESIGVEVRDAAGNFRDFESIVRDLTRAMRDMPSPDRMNFFTEIFRERGGLAFSTLMTQEADALRGILEKLGDAEGSAARVAGERMDTLTQQAKNLTDALKDVGIEFFNAFGNDMTQLLKNTSRELQLISILLGEQGFGGKARDIADWLEAPEIQGNMPPAGAAAPIGTTPPSAAATDPERMRRILRSQEISAEVTKEENKRRAKQSASKVKHKFDDSLGLFGELSDILQKASPKLTKPIDTFGDLRKILQKSGPPRVREFRPEMMGIEEFQRQTQLGVLDKKDKHLEQIVDNTKRTADGVANMKSNTTATFG